MTKAQGVLLWIVIAIVVATWSPLSSQDGFDCDWKSVAAQGPEGLIGHSMVYDAARGFVVLFGGCSDPSQVGPMEDGLWLFDGEAWTRVAASGPIGRWYSAMAPDPETSGLVLFGGNDGSGYIGELGDTWFWDGERWIQLDIVGPSARDRHGMVYDRKRGRIVLFGGHSRGNGFNDVWEFDGVSWKQVEVIGTAPAPRYDFGMTYDSRRGVVVVHGGIRGQTTYFDTWEWDGTSWTLVDDGSSGPGVYNGQLAFDEARGVTVLFGGAWRPCCSSTLAETWTWDGVSWQRLEVSGPLPRAAHALAYDARRHVVVMFGGGGSPLGILLDDTWELGCNLPPQVDAGGPYVVPEGGLVELRATGSDPEGGTILSSWDLDGDGVFESPGPCVPFSAAAIDGPTTLVVAVEAIDESGQRATDEAEIEVLNVPPTVGTIVGPIDPVRVATVVEVAALFEDPGILDTHVATVDWGDLSLTSGDVSEDAGFGSVRGNHAYSAPGVYPVTLMVTDDDGQSGSSTFRYVVVYDPEGGFVTGGGWIESPEGAFALDPSLSGRASFGFVSRYKPGAVTPTGQTRFQFKVGDLDFQSETYQWLVVSGSRAQYKGTGTVNGEGDFGFLLTAIDGDLAEEAASDRFRIKIWDRSTDQVLYDNQLDADDDSDPTTILGGGNIVVHKG